MAVFLFPNRMKDTDLAVTRHAAQQLRSLSVPVISVTGNERELGGLGVTFLTETEAFTAADHVVTVGGDGTLLRAAPSCVRANNLCWASIWGGPAFWLPARWRKCRRS